MLDKETNIWRCIFIMKFSKEVRNKVVMQIESGRSIRGTARRYGIDKNTAKTWYRNYLVGGFEQLHSTNIKYSREFKQKAVEYLRRNGLSYSQAAADLGVPNQGTLWFWERIYEEQGPAGLEEKRKGRTPWMPKKDNRHKPTVTREEELEAENARLRMENAYLKKLKALVEKREKSKKKTK